MRSRRSRRGARLTRARPDDRTGRSCVSVILRGATRRSSLAGRTSSSRVSSSASTASRSLRSLDETAAIYRRAPSTPRPRSPAMGCGPAAGWARGESSRAIRGAAQASTRCRRHCQLRTAGGGRGRQGGEFFVAVPLVGETRAEGLLTKIQPGSRCHPRPRQRSCRGDGDPMALRHLSKFRSSSDVERPLGSLPSGLAALAGNDISIVRRLRWTFSRQRGVSPHSIPTFRRNI